jgi:hypothetical protein
MYIMKLIKCKAIKSMRFQVFYFHIIVRRVLLQQETVIENVFNVKTISQKITKHVLFPRHCCCYYYYYYYNYYYY